MKRLLASLLLVSSLALTGCSSAQLASLQNGLANFQSGVASVDQTIATVSPTLAKYCNQAQAVGQTLVSLAGSSSSASAGLASVNAGIQTWCQAPPSDIQSAVASVVAIVAAGKAAYKSAKAGN